MSELPPNFNALVADYKQTVELLGKLLTTTKKTPSNPAQKDVEGDAVQGHPAETQIFETAYNALSLRDQIDDNLQQGLQLGEVSLQELQETDGKLRTRLENRQIKRKFRLRELRKVYTQIPRARWWWYIDQGQIDEDVQDWVHLSSQIFLFLAGLIAVYITVRVAQIQLDAVSVFVGGAQFWVGTIIFRRRRAWLRLVLSIAALAFVALIPIWIFPEVARGIYSAGQASSNAGDIKGAVDRFRISTRLFRPTIWPLIVQEEAGGQLTQLGLALEANGKNADAIIAYEEALEADPRILLALNQLANLYIDESHEADALKLSERAIELARRFLNGEIDLPISKELALRDMVKAYIATGRAHLNQGDYFLADQAFEHGEIIVEANSEMFISFEDLTRNTDLRQKGDITELYYFRGYAQLHLKQAHCDEVEFSEIRGNFLKVFQIADVLEETMPYTRWRYESDHVVAWLERNDTLDCQSILRQEQKWPTRERY